MRILRYDGRFESLLTLLPQWERGERIIPDGGGPVAFLGVMERRVEANPLEAAETTRTLRERGGETLFRLLRYAFFSELPGREEALGEFYQAVLRFGREADRHYELPGVVKTVEMAKRTGRDVHRWKGFLRFRLLGDGVFYAPFEPDHNVLPFLTAHFRKRLGDQEWMVHDLKRSIAALCREGRVGYARVEAPGWLLRSPSLRDAPDGFYAEEEERFQDLWKGFFRSIAIESRKNLKLQRQFMPKKYQKYLLEKEELPGASPAKGLKRGFEG